MRNHYNSIDFCRNFHVMLARALPLFGCALLCALVTGCAFSRTETQVNFAPKINEPLRAEPKSSLVVGEIKDSRTVADGNVLIHKANAYGPTSGAYVTKTPVAEIFKNGLTQALKQNGFISSNVSKYELQADIQEFSIGGFSGFWQATVLPKLVVRFELLDKASQLPVWHDTFMGRTTGKTAMGDKDFLARMFSESANDVTKQLLTDKMFRSYFE